MTIPPKAGILEIDVYVPGRSEAAGAKRIYKLSSNESPFGPSPAAIAAYQGAVAALGVYPEGTSRHLREAIAAHFGLHSERIICGNGSDELLHLIANCYVRPNEEVLFFRHSFSLYKIAAHANSAVPVEVPTPDLEMRADALLAKVTPRTRLVYIANPNNPTGRYMSVAELRRLHAALPASAILVIDAAYAEYVRRNDYEAGIELVSTSANVVMTRTFSKIYGLAGIRIGWAYAPRDIAEVLNRVRAPFNVNAAAQRAAAAALQDRAYAEKAFDHNEIWRSWLIEKIRALKLNVDESVGNFVLIHFKDADHAAAADRFLMSRGVILRACGSYDLPECLRLSVGSEEANKAVVEALSEFVALQ